MKNPVSSTPSDVEDLSNKQKTEQNDLQGENRNTVGSDLGVCKTGEFSDKSCNVQNVWEINNEKIVHELEGWLEMIRKTSMTELNKDYSIPVDKEIQDSEKEQRAFYTITSCDSPEGIWNYKYSGSKGKNKGFHGKGKLSFTINKTPPNGYNYGMKSGHCLKIPYENLKNIESIEGFFDEKGILNGHGVRIKYRNGRLIKATVVKGVMHGLVLEHDVKIDPETNRPSEDSPVLSKISLYNNGMKEIDEHEWHLLQNGIKIFRCKNLKSKSIIFVPKGLSENKEVTETEKPDTLSTQNEHNDHQTNVIFGNLDLKDKMVLSAQNVVSTMSSKIEDGLFVVDFDADSQDGTHIDSSQNDYDLQTGSWTNAVTAKLSRFIEIITNSKNTLADNFKPMPKSDSASEIKIPLMKLTGMKKVGKDGDVLHLYISCPYSAEENIKGKLRKRDLDKKGKLSGVLEIQMLTTLKRKDIAKAYQANPAPPPSNNTVKDSFSHEYLAQRIDIRQHESDSNEGESEDDLLTYQESPFKFNSQDIVESIKANFQNGKIKDGTVATIKFTDSSSIEGFVRSNCFHGMVRYLDPPLPAKKPLKRYSKNKQINRVQQIGQVGLSEDATIVEVNRVGVYKNGFLDGPSWDFRTESLLYRNSVRNEKESDTFGAHIENDYSISYAGHFIGEKMNSGYLADIIGQKEVDQIRIPQFSKPLSDTIYNTIEFSDIVDGKVAPTSNLPSSHLVADPVEDKWVYVKESENITNMYTEHEDGLFAKIDIPEKQIVSFFGGIIIDKESWNQMRLLDPVYFRPVYTDHHGT